MSSNSDMIPFNVGLFSAQRAVATSTRRGLGSLSQMLSATSSRPAYVKPLPTMPKGLLAAELREGLSSTWGGDAPPTEPIA